MSVYVIAEAGMNHDGSLGNAIRMVGVAAEAGVDAVKFQLHDATAETTRDAPAPPYFQHESRWEYFQRTAFTDDQWRRVKEACEAAGVEFVCAPFSLEALERLEGLGTTRYKIGSGEVTNLELVRAAAATGKPVLLSSGMSSLEELDAAVALGASVVEKHFTLSREMYGPDAALALEPHELEELVDGVREIEAMLAAPVDKDAEAAALAEMKRVFEKSVVTAASIPAGATIERGMLAAKKPGTGIPAARIDEVVGRRAARDLPEDTVVTEDLLA